MKTGSHKESQRDAIVEMAYSMFLESGYDNVTLKDIATACDITPSLLQYYFPKRANIVVAMFYDLILRCSTFVADEMKRVPGLPDDDSDFVCLDAFYHLFYRILHLEDDKLLRIYTVVLYDAELLKGGIDLLWSHPGDFVLPSRTFKSRVGAYALNGSLSQFVPLYLSDPLNNDLDSFVTLALGMCYGLLEVEGPRLENIKKASGVILDGDRAQAFVEQERP